VGEEASLGQWSRGFFMGHDWLVELWDDYTPESLDEELGSYLMVLSFFPTGNWLKLFEDAMHSYAHLGRSIQAAQWSRHKQNILTYGIRR